MGYSTVPTFPSFSAIPGFELPITRSLIWRSLHQMSLAGVDVAVQPWTYPKYNWKLSASFLRQSTTYLEWQTIFAFYNTVGGSALVFQYNDPNDTLVSSSQSIGTGDSTTVAFQLVRSLGGFIEPVFAISTLTGVLVDTTTVSTASFTISNKGVLTFSSTAIPPNGQSIKWRGTYNWLCRFDQDSLELQQITNSSDRQGPLWTAKQLSFTTIKLGA